MSLYRVYFVTLDGLNDSLPVWAKSITDAPNKFFRMIGYRKILEVKEAAQ